ncbi:MULTISPECIES: hypothetical protein [unclassified Methylobacterium]|uniref:hypothetical protein n=1 Tax=unclassified Methylobacterium TaxID=2615210 RepID=UPI0012E8381B|nr:MULTISPECIES: hypothetical protein [unclassified Methylobacterium]
MATAFEPLRSGSRVIAAFQPRRTDDLKAAALSRVGCVGMFEALWLIDADYHYAGEWAMRIPTDWDIEDAIWVPDGDLTPVDGHGMASGLEAQY